MPTRIAMAVGVGALVWALFYMQFIVITERDEAHDLLEERQNALAEYAMATYERFVRDDLATALPRIEKAAKDPLVDDDGLFFIEAGKLVLPRVAEYRAGSDTPATKLYDTLISGEDVVIDEDNSPYANRVLLLADLRRALDRNDRKNIENTFRKILTEKLRFRIAAVRDIPLTLVALDLLVKKSDPDRSLMEKLLRDGLTTTRGGKIEGLQRQFINARSRFTQNDFNAMAKKIAIVSERVAVKSEDFLKVIKAAEMSNRKWLHDHFEWNNLDKPLPAVLHGTLYVTRIEGRIVGMSLAKTNYRTRVRTEMTERRLVSKADGFAAINHYPPEYQTLEESIPFVIFSERWNKAWKKVNKLFLIKTGLVIALALSAGAIIFLAYRYQERKERYLKLQSNFIATVSHELRTPLASIRLLAETIQKKLAKKGVEDEYHPRIVKEIDGLTFLVENILSYNRLEKGGWKLHKSRVRLGEIVVWIRDNAPLFTDRDAKIKLVEGADIEIDADPDLLKLLFLNLARNACRYNERNPVVIDIEAKKTDRVAISISDNGVGIPSEEFEKVFTEFYRPEGTAKTVNQGSGLGLAVCRRVMGLHGGSIRISESSLNGTTFEVII